MKKIEVVPYSPKWPEMFASEAMLIKQVFGNNCIAIHHIGSTAVPGLSAKPIIDILLVVRDLQEVDKVTKAMEALGYKARGECGVPFRRYFPKAGNTYHVHVYQEGNPEIELNLTFLDYLKNHPQVRDEYGALKLKLLKDKTSFEKNDSMFTGYTLGKDAFIRKALKLAGFQRLRFVRCVHYAEWDFAKKMRQKYFFDKIPMTDPYEWTFNHLDHIHFILCQGTDMIGYAHIQLWPNSRAAIRIIVVDETKQSQGFGKQFLIWIETWLKEQGYLSIHTESSPNAVRFYEQMGYKKMPFNDPSNEPPSAQDIAMGKVLEQ